jgi:hypothetical protein
MIRQPVFIKEDKKPLKPKADEQSHQPAKSLFEKSGMSVFSKQIAAHSDEDHGV